MNKGLFTRESLNHDTFNQYYPAGVISRTEQEGMPAEIMDFFERKSSLYTRTVDYVPGNFNFFAVIEQIDNTKTFIANQTKTYSSNNDTENLTYLYETNSGLNFLGRGEIRMNLTKHDAYFADKPFVGFTYTEEHLRRNGYGKRRLLIMNALSQMIYNLPLHSDSLIVEPADKPWKRLVAEGVAESYIQKSVGQRFRFK